MQAPPGQGSPPARKAPARKAPPRQQKPPARTAPQQTPPPAPLTPAQVIAAILSALGAALTAAQLVTLLAKIMAVAGIGLLALRAVAVLMMSWPADVLEGTGPAQRHAIRMNATRRAQFMLSACQRVQAAVVAARSQGTPVLDAIRKAMAAEQRWLAAHVHASQNRIAAASAVDGMADAYGNLLGWNSVPDSRCTPECRNANHKNFYADRPPAIGYPGSTHPNCRCWPSAPFKGARVLPST